MRVSIAYPFKNGKLCVRITNKIFNMGLLNAILGNASEVDLNQVRSEFSAVLCDGEELLNAFRVIRDMFVFTNKRLILLDVQGVTGKKREYLSVPYKSISRFAVETAGTLDDDCELKIWLGSDPTPIVKEFRRGTDIKGIQRMLAQRILG